MKRITNKYWRNLDSWEMCGQDRYCKRGCHDEGGCINGCIVPKLYIELAKREDIEQKEVLAEYEKQKGDTNELPVQVTSVWQVYTKEHTATGQIYTNAEDADKCAEAIEGYVVEARLIKKEGAT